MEFQYLPVALLATLMLAHIIDALVNKVTNEKIVIGVPGIAIILGLSIGLVGIGPEIHGLGNALSSFSFIVLLLVAYLIMADTMHVTLDDVKLYKWFYLYATLIAILSVVLIGSLILHSFHFEALGWSMAEVIMITVAATATDPVITNAVLGKFPVPYSVMKKLEGESLGNDATALTIAGYYAKPVTIGASAGSAAVIGAVTNGLVGVVVAALIGYLFYLAVIYLMKLANDVYYYFFLLATAGVASFIVAEHIGELVSYFVHFFHMHLHLHFHAAGIFATVVFGILTFSKIEKRIHEDKHKIDHEEKEILHLTDVPEENSKEVKKRLNLLRSYTIEQKEHENLEKVITVGATIMSLSLVTYMGWVLGISGKNIADAAMSVVLVFTVVTVLRIVHAFVAQMISHMAPESFGGKISTAEALIHGFSGFQGGLNIAIISILPANYSKIVVMYIISMGNILLSFIVNTAALNIVMKLFNEELKRQKEEEEAKGLSLHH